MIQSIKSCSITMTESEKEREGEGEEGGRTDFNLFYLFIFLIINKDGYKHVSIGAKVHLLLIHSTLGFLCDDCVH